MTEQAVLDYLATRGITDPTLIEGARVTLKGNRVRLPFVDAGGTERGATARSLNGETPTLGRLLA